MDFDSMDSIECIVIDEENAKNTVSTYTNRSVYSDKVFFFLFVITLYSQKPKKNGAKSGKNVRKPKNWRPERFRTFSALLEKYELLYNIDHEHHKNVQLKQTLWKKLAAEWPEDDGEGPSPSVDELKGHLFTLFTVRIQ